MESIIESGPQRSDGARNQPPYQPGAQRNDRPSDQPRQQGVVAGEFSTGDWGARAGGLQQALGWFSIGLGVVELLQPRALNRAIGTGQHPGLTRFCGLREIISGVGMLSGRAPAAWAWSRVAGDVMDLALLASAASSRRADKAKIAIATTSVLGVAALDIQAVRMARAAPSVGADSESVQSRASVIIKSSPEELYGFWRNPGNLPRFMRHLHSVQSTGERTSKWTAKGPAGREVSWNSEITTDIENRQISWRTLPDSEVTHTGTVTFEPATNGTGTVVRVEMKYQPPAGAVGDALAKLLGFDPQHQIRDDLRRLKQLQETGEVATVQGQPAGKRSLLGRMSLGGRLQ